MGKYLTNFKTKEEYEDFKASGEYLTPNVSFIETAGSVINDSYQVPTSGVGGGSASSWKYFDMSMELPNKEMLIAYFAMLAKIDNQITTGASLILAGEEAFSQVKAIAVDLSKNIISPANGELISLENFLSTTGIAFKEITEEEFYNLDNGGGVA